MIGHRMTFDYSLAPGWLAPYVDGLVAGRAIARRCAACDRTSFPPLRRCDCGETDGDWRELAGRADILWRCRGADGSFALVRFAGADTLSVVRTEGVDDSGRTGWLRPLPEGLPKLVLHPEPMAEPK